MFESKVSQNCGYLTQFTRHMVALIKRLHSTYWGSHRGHRWFCYQAPGLAIIWIL